MPKADSWNTRLGVILAVSGSAVGLGNFLRFPGQAAEYGGGAFMVAYFISFFIIGLPICWAEWTMGRYAGQRGYNAASGVFHFILHNRWGKYLGIIGFVIPVVIYMYYVVIEAWCLGYAVNFLRGAMHFETVDEAGNFFATFVGVRENASAMGFGVDQVGIYLALVFILNFVLVYRGLAKGIEWFCKYAMPTLIVLAVVILIRVLTLGTPDVDQPTRSISNGLGFMWNPTKVFVVEQETDENGRPVWVRTDEIVGKGAIAAATAAVADDPTRRLEKLSLLRQLKNPNLWLAAAGQIFFSLSVGFGIIITYASYLKRDDDVVLSGLAAASANEFAEVGLGGLITIPAAVAFLGIAGAAGQGTFALGFQVLPMVFSAMPAGAFFGFLFFFLLFLAAVTSSLSMLQPGIAFLEEAINLSRKQSVAILGIITALGCMIVVYFSADLKALDTLDFWVGTFLIYVLATITIVVFSWVLGLPKAFEEAHRGASLQIPRFFAPIMRFICPAFLLLIFAFWLGENLFGYNPLTGEFAQSTRLGELFGEDANAVARLSVTIIIFVALFVALLISSSPRYRGVARADEPMKEEQA